MDERALLRKLDGIAKAIETQNDILNRLVTMYETPQYGVTPSNPLDRLGEPQKLRDISGPL